MVKRSAPLHGAAATRARRSDRGRRDERLFSTISEVLIRHVWTFAHETREPLCDVSRVFNGARIGIFCRDGCSERSALLHDQQKSLRSE